MNDGAGRSKQAERMQWSSEQVRWLVKVLQPDRTVASLPGRATLDEGTRAALLGLEPDVYSGELARLASGAKEAARELLADADVSAMVDRLPLRKGARIVAFGDSRTSDPQSWAVIVSEMLAARRPADEVALVNSAVSGETTTHGLVRFGEVVALDPDWILFFIGVNDARTQGAEPTKTLVDERESARNFAELRSRARRETKARCLWITPPAVIEERVARHWALSGFGVRFRNEQIARVAEAVRDVGDATIDLFASLGAPPPPELLMEDGLHLTQAGQKRLAREIVCGWSRLAATDDAEAR